MSQKMEEWMREEDEAKSRGRRKSGAMSQSTGEKGGFRIGRERKLKGNKMRRGEKVGQGK